jgi:hypothetical protein
MRAAATVLRPNVEIRPSVRRVFLFCAFLAGGMSASFYGWFPLYLPELFPTAVRATGQGFAYNFERILAAVGGLQTAALMALFGGSFPKAGSVLTLFYFVGLVIIWPNHSGIVLRVPADCASHRRKR